MKRFIHFPSFIVFIVVVAILAWIAQKTIGLSYWFAVGIIVAAILINGVVILFEKEGPSIDSSPD